MESSNIMMLRYMCSYELLVKGIFHVCVTKSGFKQEYFTKSSSHKKLHWNVCWNWKHKKWPCCSLNLHISEVTARVFVSLQKLKSPRDKEIMRIHAILLCKNIFTHNSCSLFKAFNKSIYVHHLILVMNALSAS
jgi:hypothetical protein